MPDNSAEPHFKRKYQGLPRGRFPKWLKPTVPFRVFELGKGRRVRPPEWWPEPQKVMASGKRYFPPEGAKLEGTALRGRPGPGTLAIIVGDKARAPRPPDLPSGFHQIKEGAGRTEAEAQRRANAWLRAKFLESVGKARRRARKSAEGTSSR